jgi:hypothetical protein
VGVGVNKEYVIRQVLTGAPKETTPSDVEKLIPDAERILGNLIHYRSGGKHEDEDLAYVIRVLLAARRCL